MAGRGSPGPAPQAEKRAHHARLIAQGVNNSEACRIVGVGRRTGTRWRFGRLDRQSDGTIRETPAVITKLAKPKSDRYLSEDERLVIADGVRAGTTIRAIAAGLSRDPSTVSREVRRNRDPASGSYHPFAAQRRAVARRRRDRPGKLAADTALRAVVERHLQLLWSPEQIALALPRLFPDEPVRHVVHETIYQAIYRPERGGLQRPLPQVLRTRRTRRRLRRRPDARRHGTLPDMRMVTERSVDAVDRLVPGHWEGDCIMGAGNRSAIATLVERSTRFLVLVHIPTGSRSDAVRRGVLATLGELPPALRRSLTWDQGKEMAMHEQITAGGVPVFFCDKASPWQRPTNENTNGLLRQYFPKGSDLAAHDPQHLIDVAAQLNARPRKTLGGGTPTDHFSALITQRTDTWNTLLTQESQMAVLRR